MQIPSFSNNKRNTTQSGHPGSALGVPTPGAEISQSQTRRRRERRRKLKKAIEEKKFVEELEFWSRFVEKEKVDVKGWEKKVKKFEEEKAEKAEKVKKAKKAEERKKKKREKAEELEKAREEMAREMEDQADEMTKLEERMRMEGQLKRVQMEGYKWSV